MKKTFSLIVYCMLFTAASTQAQQKSTTEKRLAKYVVLISIDGLRPDFYLDPAWSLPNLQFLKNNGAYANGVRGVFPTVTYPSHTTIITGAFPAKHGIYYNTIFADSGSTSTWFREEKMIQVPTLWDAVHDAGMTSACVSWPVSVGAPVDYNLPESWEKNAPHNPNVTPAGLWEEIQQNATGKLTYDQLNMNNLSIDENFSRMAAYLIRKYKPNFTTLHIVSVDHAQHSVGRNGEEVKKALASADHAISNVMEAIEAAGIKDSTTIIVTGDHGFSNIHTSFAPNVLLSNMGLIKSRTDWKATFHTSGAAAFLHLKDPADKKLLIKIKAALDSLPANVKKLFRVVEREELARIGADPHAALAIAPVEGVSVTGSTTGDIIRQGKGGTHGFFPDFDHIKTGFIAYGAGVNRGVEIQLMGLEDIAPVITRLLGLSFNAPDGVLLPGILRIPTERDYRRPVVNGNINASPDKE